ncbi:MAG: secondary metabolism, biosynthesis of secondary products derived from primary amino acid, partial [Phycisphaerales bacterium]|nr:secondary metabolism, biosynthesis of secondary products derived from primary amino acid [Phycisphaerales bacterium]
MPVEPAAAAAPQPHASPLFATGLLLACVFAPAARAADRPQWGEAGSRNMASPETGLPAGFDPVTGTNVKWVAALGTESYASPVVAGGRVLIGTNNEHPRDPRHRGDRAVLRCLDERDGHLLWQFVVPKLSEDERDPYLDWPKAGFASAPTIEGDRAYTLTNRGEVVCLDMKGMADGNDGPFLDEARHAAPRGHPQVEPGPTDADVLWSCDLVAEAGVRTHDQVHGSVLVRGDLLYVNACNGVDDTHRVIRRPDAPSLVVLDKRTGRIVARDGRHLGPATFHCAWSSPSFGEVGGRSLVFFGGPDGTCYAFDALAGVPAAGPAVTLADAWRFDTDPTGPKGEDVHKWVGNRRDGPSVIMGMAVFQAGGGAAG